MHNIWLQNWTRKNIKSKCKFVLYEWGPYVSFNSPATPIYHTWSEVYWTNKSMARHTHVMWDDLNDKLSWIMPHACHIDGFCIIHDTKGVLLRQSIANGRISGGGVDLNVDEQIQIDISGIQILP